MNLESVVCLFSSIFCSSSERRYHKFLGLPLKLTGGGGSPDKKSVKNCEKLMTMELVPVATGNR